MIKIDPKLLRESPELRKKIREVERLEKEAKMRVAFRYLLSEGESYGHALEAVAEFFDASRSTVKRAARGLAAAVVPERLRPARELTGKPSRPPEEVSARRSRVAKKIHPWLPLGIEERIQEPTSRRRPT